MSILGVEVDFDGAGEVRFERLGFAGIITLSRPQALNALTLTMVRAITRALDAWRTDPAVRAVVVRGEGRAFCAGGDILAVYHARENPKADFFAEEYRLNVQIAEFPKPYVALIDGIVMGGGVGLSCHGSHRVMTENALFAMPEVGIGFFPDVGGSHLLCELGDNFGMYLALTGARVKWGDALMSGLATHTVKSEMLPGLLEQIAEDGTPDEALRNVFSIQGWQLNQHDLLLIERAFGAPTIEGVVSALEHESATSEFAASTLSTIRKRSPTSVAVAFRQIRAGVGKSMRECMTMEFRILNRMLTTPDFYEGIRTVLVDKGAEPSWQPPRLEDISAAEIDSYFAPPTAGDLRL